MRRSYDKHIRLTKEEKDDWQRKAEMTCLTESSLIRLLMKGFSPKQKPDDRFYEAMRELSAIGNNINQLAAKAHSLGFVDTPMLYREVERWHKFQADIERCFLRPDKADLKWQ